LVQPNSLLLGGDCGRMKHLVGPVICSLAHCLHVLQFFRPFVHLLTVFMCFNSSGIEFWTRQTFSSHYNLLMPNECQLLACLAPTQLTDQWLCLQILVAT
jgi:hypothetical protein